MKKLKLVSVLGCVLAAMSLTSCLNEDDGSSTYLTPEQVKACFAIVGGNHYGQLIYPSENPNNISDNADSVSISWSIPNDSTMIIRQFPVRLLGSQITNTKMKELFEDAENQDLTCRIGFISTSPVQFLVNPFTIDTGLTDDAGLKIKVAFWINSYNSWGEYNSSLKKLGIQIVEGAIYVGDQQSSYLTTSGIPFKLISD